MSSRLAGSARVAIAAVSIGLGAAACGSARGTGGRAIGPPGVDESTSVPPVSQETNERTTTPITTVPADTTLATVAPEPGVSEAEVTELEQQLDEIDRVLADLEAQLSED